MKKIVSFIKDNISLIIGIIAIIFGITIFTVGLATDEKAEIWAFGPVLVATGIGICIIATNKNTSEDEEE